jgi:hypothetical protein
MLEARAGLGTGTLFIGNKNNMFFWQKNLKNDNNNFVTKGMLEEHGLVTVPGSSSMPAGRKSAVKTKAPLSAGRGSTR